MVQVSYSGVYIQEKSRGVRTITGVATSIAAFVDAFPRGLLDEAVQCLGFADFEREFGGIHTSSPASYGIKQFFQNGGGECWVVRVANITDAVLGTIGAIAASVPIDDTPTGVAGTALFNAVAGRRIRGEAAQNPGLWGNDLHLDVDYATADPTASFNVTVSEIVTQNGRRVVRRTGTFRNLTMDPAAPNFATVNETSRIVQLDRRNLAGTADLPALPVVAPFPRPAATGSLGNLLPDPEVIPADGATFNVTVADDVDPPVVRPARTATLSYGGPAPGGYQALRPFVEAAIRALANDPLVTAETERSLLAGATVRLLGTGSAAAPFRYLVQAGRGGAAYRSVATLDVEGPAGADLGFPAAVAPNMQQHRLAGGLDGIMPVGTNALTGNLAVGAHESSGMHLDRCIKPIRIQRRCALIQ